jgi:drug/metabolite transporter (DMT)-like permease
MHKLKGFLSLLACAVIFGSMSIFIRLLSKEMSVYQQIGFRNFVSLIISLAIILITKQSFFSIKKVSLKHIIPYMFMFQIGVILFTFSVLMTKVVITVFGLYLGSLLTSLLLGMVFFQEKLTPMKMVSLGLVVLGLTVYTYPFNFSLLGGGFFLAVLAGFFDATANSLRKHLSGKVDRFVLVSLQMIGGLIAASVMLAIFGPLALPSLSLSSWVVGIIFGIEVVAIAYLTLIGFQNFDLNLGTIVLSTELFWGSLFAFLVFGEASTTPEILGGMIILIASVVANMAVEDIPWWKKFIPKKLLKI